MCSLFLLVFRNFIFKHKKLLISFLILILFSAFLISKNQANKKTSNIKTAQVEKKDLKKKKSLSPAAGYIIVVLWLQVMDRCSGCSVINRRHWSIKVSFIFYFFGSIVDVLRL